MRFLLSLTLLSTILLTSCVQDDPGVIKAQPGGDEELLNKIEQLELDNKLKDSVINESLAFFNEIKSNLEAINIRKDHIRVLSDNPELSSDDKEWILEEIRHINFLREENASKVRQLNKQVKDSGLKINELQLMIDNLVKEIQWKDEQISLLQNELDDLDKEYSALFDAYQVQSIEMNQLTKEMNTVYYAYGTVEELQENGVIEYKNGFIGLGKKTILRDDFNDEYFTKIDASQTSSIRVIGNNARVITNHPAGSYTLDIQGGKTFVKIKDASEFWKISNYLVVVVE